ncbi:hypothetical protein LPICM17_70105 [Lactococcus piscium]|nr:hypothetical protein LP2241_10337 [Lactococcus piscium]SOB49031.1 hypothetical protein LPICM17_70105 [Lactococcus piscium]
MVFSIESNQIIEVLFVSYEDEQDRTSETNESKQLIKYSIYKFRKKR